MFYEIKPTINWILAYIGCILPIVGIVYQYEGSPEVLRQK